jgi:xanthine/uracil permease
MSLLLFVQVALRPVALVCGIMLFVVGFVGKIGAVFVAISQPIIGGMFIAMFGENKDSIL